MSTMRSSVPADTICPALPPRYIEMAQPTPKDPKGTPSTFLMTTSESRAQEPSSKDVIQRLKDLDEQAKISDPERQARIEKGKRRKPHSFGGLVCFCCAGFVSGGS